MSKLNSASALLLIEFQQEWLSEKGKLHHLWADKRQFYQSLENAQQIVEAVRKTNLPVIHSGLSFSAGYSVLGEAKHGVRAAIVTNQTFLANSEGAQFSTPFIPQEHEFVVTGRTGTNVFVGSNLDIYLRNNHITTLYIMGYALHVCVESTMRAAHDLGYETIVIEDATAAFTAAQKEYFLTNILHHFGSTITTQDYLALIKKEEAKL